MLRPLGKNVLIKKFKEQNSVIIMNEDSNFYEVIAVGSLVKEDIVGKKVFADKVSNKIDYNGETYFIVSIDDILMVEE